VKINLRSIKDEVFVAQANETISRLAIKTQAKKDEVVKVVNNRIGT
jgi:formiminotetrahydrofolate cyclodeaminase